MLAIRFKKDDRGDSLVEVLLSLAVLSLVVLISWTIVNRAANINLASRQRVVMVNALREQAELLEAYYAAGESSRAYLIETTQTTGGIPIVLGGDTHVYETAIPANPCRHKNEAGRPIPDSAFHFTDEAGLGTGIKDNIAGYQDAYLWVQKRVGKETEPKGNYVDFYVRACWRSTGSTQTDDSSQFVVRLNR